MQGFGMLKRVVYIITVGLKGPRAGEKKLDSIKSKSCPCA
jgi:hypothetical protein